jgi:hypothetical protein
MMVPLMHLTYKNLPWIWSPACDKVFNILKVAFTTAPILIHFDPALPPVVKTNASDYAITSILSLCAEVGEVHPVAFYSCTLTGAELNYNTHDKELLVIYKAFKIWHHYLKSPHHTINIITDHKNLEYFTTTKVLSCCQVHWSKYLSTFNMVVHFHPGKLGEKPDSLTCRMDYYLKWGDREYMLANPQNLHPVFLQEKFVTVLHAMCLQEVIACATSILDDSVPILDAAALFEDLKIGLQEDSLAHQELASCLQGSPSPHLFLSSSGLLLMDHHVYVPEYQPKQGNLQTHILQAKHNHPTTGHFSYNKTLELLCQDYV